ncbi:MAG: alpha/beta fold hydrolase [Betaproteobacteria bacterium]|nr:alpha/beta fold hydrolase [Betaproteobacteria bacterium]
MASQGDARAAEPAEEWRNAGQYFTWKSTLPENNGRSTRVFYTCAGDAANPAILMLHGFPTSSFDFRDFITDLRTDYRVCTLDFPGYGVSDKPGDGYRYSLRDDARLVWYFVTSVVPLQDFVLFSHDRADSVSLDFLQLLQAAPKAPFRIRHQFLTNANLYLPLANLTDFQKAMLNPATSAAAVQALSPEQLAAGLGKTQYSPPLERGDPEVRALGYNFAYKDGIKAIPGTIQYLNERMKSENDFLDALARSAIPVTMIWGAHDMVSPVRVADYVWDRALKRRTAPAAYWLAPCANHYLLHDQHQAISTLVRLALSDNAPAAPHNLTDQACSPVLVDRH